jgi:glycosidase
MPRSTAAWLLASTLLFPRAHAQDYRIQHMEPAFWWSGMQHKQLQLMVHGPKIADLEPSLDYPGARIVSVARVTNRNYMFIDLQLDGAAPGRFDIVFSKSGKAAARYAYELRARAPGSAQRQGFNTADAIYQVMPDRFANGDPSNDSVTALAEKSNRKNGSGRHGGDLQGMADHLDYVASMGYTQIWPTPLVENNQPDYSYHGYAATDHYKVDARYGSNEDYVRFVAKAREKGIGVIQDVVLSHIGSSHWWMKDIPMPDWISYDGKFVPTTHHRVAVQDPYGSKEDARNFTQGWFGKHMPDMNQTNPFVANYLIQNNIWWIEYAGLSGLRVDTYGYSDTRFLTEWSRRLMLEYPNLNMVGEEWSMRIPVVAHWQAGKQNFDGYVSHIPSMMDFPLNDVLRKALADTDGTFSFNDVYETLAQDYLYPNASNLVLFEGNHDMSRTFSVVNDDPALWRMAMAFTLTAPRIPQLYYGTEILMPSTVKGRDDPSYRHDMPGGWAGDAVNAFTGAGLSAQQREAQAWLRKLLNWRKTAGAIHHGRMMHYGPEENTYVYFRYDGSSKVMVAFNKNPLPVSLATARFREMLAGARSGTDVLSGQSFALDAATLTLPARSALVLEVK